ncbi:MAG: DNA replication and repair protein RecF, partial [Prevotella sp.]|nr:DNA replication and repair protein RecF [Prevotella sp.]
DTLLIEGGSEERRRLMDVVIAQYDKSYIESLASYNRALQQRNVLLKQEEEPDAQLLDILELEMGRHGEAVYRARAAFIEQLIPSFQRIYRFIADHPQTPPQQEGTANEEVSLRYVSHCQRGPLYDVIHRDRMKDRVVGYSLHGIHRDDLEMLLGGYQMKREGSQGQNKTYVLALKLAQFEFLCHTVSTTMPILLLDDIFDKLDASRVEQIIRLVSGDDYGQIFITDTNRDHLDRILRHSALDYRLFHVEQGEVSVHSS